MLSPYESEIKAFLNVSDNEASKRWKEAKMKISKKYGISESSFKKEHLNEAKNLILVETDEEDEQVFDPSVFLNSDMSASEFIETLISSSINIPNQIKVSPSLKKHQDEENDSLDVVIKDDKIEEKTLKPAPIVKKEKTQEELEEEAKEFIEMGGGDVPVEFLDGSTEEPFVYTEAQLLGHYLNFGSKDYVIISAEGDRIQAVFAEALDKRKKFKDNEILMGQVFTFFQNDERRPFELNLEKKSDIDFKHFNYLLKEDINSIFKSKTLTDDDVNFLIENRKYPFPYERQLKNQAEIVKKRNIEEGKSKNA